MQESLSLKTVRVLAAYGDDVVCMVTRVEARSMKAAGTHHFVNHGKDLRAVPSASPETLLERELTWNPRGQAQASVLCRGAASYTKDSTRVRHFSYPIPFSYEGHLSSPRAAIINFLPQSL